MVTQNTFAQMQQTRQNTPSTSSPQKRKIGPWGYTTGALVILGALTVLGYNTLRNLEKTVQNLHLTHTKTEYDLKKEIGKNTVRIDTRYNKLKEKTDRHDIEIDKETIRRRNLENRISGNTERINKLEQDVYMAVLDTDQDGKYGIVTYWPRENKVKDENGKIHDAKQFGVNLYNNHLDINNPKIKGTYIGTPNAVMGFFQALANGGDATFASDKKGNNSFMGKLRKDYNIINENHFAELFKLTK